MKYVYLFLVLLVLPVFAEDTGQPPLNAAQLDEMDAKSWGIDHGCIQTRRIKSFRYYEPGSARITLTGGKEVLMRFSNSCRGLRHNGVLYETRTGKLCAKFDWVKVLNEGTHCPIDSIEPFVLPEPIEEETE